MSPSLQPKFGYIIRLLAVQCKGKINTESILQKLDHSCRAAQATALAPLGCTKLEPEPLNRFWRTFGASEPEQNFASVR
jgi:hypothetical protein